MLSIQLPESIEKRLERLARSTGRTKEDYALEAIREHLKNLEADAERREKVVFKVPVPVADAERRGKELVVTELFTELLEHARRGEKLTDAKLAKMLERARQHLELSAPNVAKDSVDDAAAFLLWFGLNPDRGETPVKKSLAQLFAESPFRGLDLDFERNSDTGRPVNL